MTRYTSSQMLAQRALLDRVKRAGMKGVPAFRSIKDLHAKDALIADSATPPIKWDRQTQRWYYVAPVTMLCFRDPDGENEYVSDGPIREITIDIGRSWQSYNHFASDLADDDENALMYEEHLIEEVSDLDPTNPVRQAVEEFFATARQNGS